MLGEVGADDVAVVGGKAASLTRLLVAGLPVPAGFVIVAAAWNAAGEMSDELRREIEAAYAKLGARAVAVRSSATAEDGEKASWAGQLETYLNVGRDGVVEAVQKCWRSVDAARARAYQQLQGGTKQKVAVIVQAMVASEKAGVAFSVNPVNKKADEMVIEAVLGLGEGLVSGEKTPSTYMVGKISGRVRQKIEESPLLNDKEVAELTALVRKIENLYARPVDVEWAQAAGQWYILQARPITTLQ